MAKINKEEEARRQGMAYALKIAKEKGIEGLEEELRFRNALHMPIGVSRKDCDECVHAIKVNVVDTVTIMAAITLRDEFEFGKQRIQRFTDRFNYKIDCLLGDYTTWQEQIEILKNECGLDYVIHRPDDLKVGRGVKG